jgi:hypothetical protein
MTTMILTQDRFGNTLQCFWITKASELEIGPTGTPEMNHALENGGDPYKLLGIAIIKKAIADLKGGAFDAYYWLISDGQDFCEEVGLDYKPIKKWVEAYYTECVSSGYLKYKQRAESFYQPCAIGWGLVHAAQQEKRARQHAEKKRIVRKHFNTCKECKKG